MSTPFPINFSALPVGLNPTAFFDQGFAAATNGGYMQDGTLPGSALVASGVAAGTYGDADHIPQFTVNSQGLLTSVSSIAIDAGAVSSVSVVSANGFTGTVATPGTTPAITLGTSVNGIVKGNGTALSAAVAGTDYVAPGGALGTPSSGVATNLTGTATGLTAGTATVANGLASATTTVVVSGAAAPSAGDVLTATSSTAAHWAAAAGGMTPVATRTTLATLSTSAAVAYLEESGRQGVFQWSGTNHAADVTADANQGIFVPPSSDTSGASGAWVRSYDGLYVEFFGVHGDAATDDLANLQNVITTMVHLGLSVLHCENVTGFALSNTLTIGNGTTSATSSYNSIAFVGKGGATVFSGATTSSVFKRITASGGDVLKIQGPIIGVSLLGAWTIDGNAKAATGLDIIDGSAGQYPNLKIKGCTGVYLRLFAASTSSSNYGGCRNNEFGTYCTDTVPSGGTGLLLDASTSVAADTLQNSFDIIDIPYSGSGAIGIQLGYCDFNEFTIVDISPQTTLSTSIAIKLVGTGPAGNTNFPSLNHFGMVAASGGITSVTTGGAPYGNMIDLYDVADSDGIVPTAVGIMGYAQEEYGTHQTQVVSFGFLPPGWNTTTPSLPGGTGSTHKVTNTNSYPVIVYSAGGVGLDIIDSHGSDAGSIPPGTQGNYYLDPGASVYFNTTVPSSWLWYGSK